MYLPLTGKKKGGILGCKRDQRDGGGVCLLAGACAPPECAAALDKIARGTGVDVKITVVTGDDVMGHY